MGETPTVPTQCFACVRCLTPLCLPSPDTAVQLPLRGAPTRDPRPPNAPSARKRGTRAMNEQLVIGMDVGSTTVKAVVIDPAKKTILWSDYQRHLTKQPEKVLELLTAIQAAFPDRPFEKEGAWR